eukprot:COSAG05_NODE_16343_length_348_cov_0.787149_1_plen_97_part_00
MPLCVDLGGRRIIKKSGSELASLASSRAPVPRPADVPALDTSAASLVSELEGLTADGQALAAQREAEAQSEALGQADVPADSSFFQAEDGIRDSPE